jgi:hypothetical protein
MTRTIPPMPPIPPDEAAREFLREEMAAAEAAGRPEMAYYAVKEALILAWETINRLRAAQTGEEVSGDVTQTNAGAYRDGTIKVE